MSQSQPYKDVAAVILAGGRGRRVGGEDKGLLELDGKPLIAHVIDVIAPQVDSLVISANRNLEQYKALAYPVISDRQEGFYGPLAGIDAALAATDKPFLLCVPCDTPFLPANLLSRLYAALQDSNYPMAIAVDGERQHPVINLMQRSVHADIRNRLQQGNLKLMRWIEETGYASVDFSDQPQALSNLNSLDDIALVGKRS
ncbi:molybdenum cofactor guanylyltransferase MobA [Sulfuriflexus sp.]|uniref:molybdenum cofactor guanylyltransferase MobA n=1 Tax=Sulfuriflexus sp. TaxID=2015443 RepID=UPI0028CD53D8|nr:molybdenum cofactor guanylyltransferase MobA [Sulfuriflexus sp.]MDT8405224.1 molybdenum cofactor guanylyltransferase MobA [Sulfuriflexus sp.]